MKRLLFFLLPFSLAYPADTLVLGPVVTLSDTSGATNSNEPSSVAINDKGQAIVAWSQNEPQPVIQSSVFRGGTWISVQDVVPPSPTDDFLVPWVGIDAFGNAIGAWNLLTSTFSVDASTLAANALTWATPANISDPAIESFTPQVATAPNGFTIAIWENSSPAIQSAILTHFSTNAWSFPVDMVETMAGAPYQLYLDPFKTPFATVTLSTTEMAVVKKTSSWATVFLAPANSFEGQLGFNRLGGGVAIWVQDGNTLLGYATFAPGGTTWSPPRLIQPAASVFAPQLGVDAAGNAVAVWLQQENTILRVFASTLASGASSWIEAIPISPAGLDIADLDMEMDSCGNAIAVWSGSSDGGVTFITQVGFLPSGTTAWQVVTIDTPTALNTTNPQIAVSAHGQLIIAWTIEGSSGNFTQALTGFIIPASPSAISAVRRENRFLFQSEFFNRICWEPGSNCSAAFRIYRNGALIAEVGGDIFCFNDHRRREHEHDVYGVSAVSGSGVESSQIEVVIQ